MTITNSVINLQTASSPDCQEMTNCFCRKLLLNLFLIPLFPGICIVSNLWQYEELDYSKQYKALIRFKVVSLSLSLNV